MKAYLALEDGFILEGRSFTGICEQGGKIVCNTSMTDLQEIITNPSYTGKMLCMTFPLAGNYGINGNYMASVKPSISALLLKEYRQHSSCPDLSYLLSDFLAKHSIPGIEGMDIRALTRHLRLHGSMRGVISTNTASPRELVAMAQCIPHMDGSDPHDTQVYKNIWTLYVDTPHVSKSAHANEHNLQTDVFLTTRSHARVITGKGEICRQN